MRLTCDHRGRVSIRIPPRIGGVTIQRIRINAADPDRWARGLADAFKNASKSMSGLAPLIGGL